MPTIDADAHVIETERTWDYLDPSEEKFRPQLVSPKGKSGREFWMVDGKIKGFRFPTLSEKELVERSERTGRDVVTPQAAREMDDVGLRLRDMDRLGIDVQVLHNTIFIEQLTDRTEIDVALCGSWNRWLADIWQQSQNRLRWSMVPPLLSIRDALDQIRFAKEHGAVAVLMRPFEGHRTMLDPYFHPVYEEAQKLDMAIAVHIANGSPQMCDILRSPYDSAPTFNMFRAPTVMACHSLLMSELPQTFPRLRWGFIEASAQWIPWILNEARARFDVQGREFPENILRDYRIYVTCQTNEDVPYILSKAGEENILIGTDYGHLDQSTEIDAITVIRQMPGISEAQLDKILYQNPKALYAL